MKLLNATTDGRPKGGIYIGRGTAVGNPYVLTHEDRRYEVVSKYRLWLFNKLFCKDNKIILFLEKIKQDDQLVCFCAPKLCHGNVIINLLDHVNTYDNSLSFRDRLDLCLKEIYPKTLNGNYDGFTHINVYSKAKTKLGRMLSNFYPCSIELEGKTFGSLEAYWYWLSTGRQHDSLIPLAGYEAKKQGKKYDKVIVEDFENTFNKALEQKILQNSDIKELFAESELQLEHYYSYGMIDNAKIIFAKEYYWQIDYLTELRKKLKQL